GRLLDCGDCGSLCDINLELDKLGGNLGQAVAASVSQRFESRWYAPRSNRVRAVAAQRRQSTPSWRKPMPALEIRWLAASLDVASISDCGCKASCYGLSWHVPPPALKRRNRKVGVMPPSFFNHSRHGTRLGHLRVSLKQLNGLQGQGP